MPCSARRWHRRGLGLVLEYAVAAGAVAVGWSGYVNGLLASAGYALPAALRTGINDGGTFNLLAFLISLVITGLLVIGTSKSAWVNAVLRPSRSSPLTAFIIVAVPAAKDVNFQPFLPAGWGTPMGGMGVLGAAASIFFAYVGFDAVSTAAEETKNPNRNIPIGLIGSLAVCTIFYLLVGYGAVGANGSQPVMGSNGMPLPTGSPELAAACQARRNSCAARSRLPPCCAASVSPAWQPDRSCRRPGAAVGDPHDDLRPDAHLLRDVARWPAAGVPPKCTPSSTRPTWSP